MTDYRLRGDNAQEQNIIAFFLDTFETSIDAKTSADAERANDNPNNKRFGRPRNERVQYAEEHPQYSCRHRVYQRSNHNTLPNFVGPPFPRNDDKDTRDLYCACMLMLLKPWRDMATDLKQLNVSWEVAFETYVNDAPSRRT